MKALRRSGDNAVPIRGVRTSGPVKLLKYGAFLAALALRAGPA